ncbi:hypothetical protein E2562_003297 [Oryza meyeriana var. granulata]|uniref:Uncharacterized protein n=1 Tax=Oryza meyeriana var. granulata TaxID=110450 RepID=A0A6G1EE82_9ORYZ|nr:hypothetical protein E2562_003297 [Oryza meyeriana var. granulata]
MDPWTVQGAGARDGSGATKRWRRRPRPSAKASMDHGLQICSSETRRPPRRLTPSSSRVRFRQLLRRRLVDARLRVAAAKSCEWICPMGKAVHEGEREELGGMEESCGACGYDLKLSSSARNTAGIVVAGGGGGYRRRRSGVVRFDAIDDARFGHVDEFRCVDVRARRLFTRRTRLLCRKCGAHVGFAYDDRAARSPSSPPPRYDIRIRALHPVEPQPSDL